MKQREVTTKKFNGPSGTISIPPEKKKKGETKYNIADRIPTFFEYKILPVKNKKQLVNVPKTMNGILKKKGFSKPIYSERKYNIHIVKGG